MHFLYGFIDCRGRERFDEILWRNRTKNDAAEKSVYSKIEKNGFGLR